MWEFINNNTSAVFLLVGVVVAQIANYVLKRLERNTQLELVHRG